MPTHKLPTNLLPHLRREMKRRNYAPLSFPLSRRDLSQAMDHFLAFAELPDETKKRFRYLVNPRDKESLVGYVKRQREAVRGSRGRQYYDRKEYFHYNRYAEEQFRNLVLESDPAARTFFKTAWNVYSKAEQLSRHIIREFDKEFPGLYDQFFPEDAHPHFYLRFLKYHPEGRGRFLAKGHYDQGAMTLALAESAPGLRIGRNDKTLQELKHQDKKAIFMPGLQLYRFTTEDFRPAWHDVVQKKEDTHSADTARWAIVFFADPASKAKTRWEDRHTPLDENSEVRIKN